MEQSHGTAHVSLVPKCQVTFAVNCSPSPMRLVSVAKGESSIPHKVLVKIQKSITACISRKPADKVKATIIVQV